ncbi:AAEL009591-PA [Aedes aegypti]|uniref:AAEL009591-PA n=1 Tax=Aedes aegypti TaxID=7159 RepID=Q16VE6_AEDAE|nr:AAEL009591-PA [Aedes aegypti]
MMELLLLGAAALTAVCYLLYRWSTSTFGYFEKRSVPFGKPYPLLGALWPYLKGEKSPVDALCEGYRHFPGCTYSGVFLFRSPCYLIHDPELIKKIAIRDFDHFADHANNVSLEVDPFMGRVLFFANGQRWKQGRTALSPAFTGSKMRNMFGLVSEYTNGAVQRLVEDAEASGGKMERELNDLFKSRLGHDAITSISLGTDIDSIREPENEFFAHGKELAKTTGLQGFRFFIMSLLPEKILRLSRMRIVPEHLANFYHGVVSKVIKHRLDNGIVRPDFIHLLLQARRNELKTDETDEKFNDAGFATVQEHLEAPTKNPIEWTDYDIAATVATFFFGGAESTTALLCFTIYELALNQHVQQKLLAEIDSVQKTVGTEKLTYESMQQMKYLDMVISETLRKWPPFGVTNRRCTKPYQIQDVDGHSVTIEKGQVVFLPIQHIHRDPHFFPNPMRFDPERFATENRDQLNQDAYLPFGAGPRNCIGSRLSLMQTKCFLYYLISTFEVQLSNRTEVPIEIDLKATGLNSKNGFWFHLIQRVK